MPLRKCAVATCRIKVELPRRYCDEHSGYSDKQYNKHVRYNMDNEKYSKFYQSTAWQRVRRLKLQQQPMCEVCLQQGLYTMADMVHHKTELRTPIIGWEKRLDMSNLQSICYECHNRIDHEYSNEARYHKH